MFRVKKIQDLNITKNIIKILFLNPPPSPLPRLKMLFLNSYCDQIGTLESVANLYIERINPRLAPTDELLTSFKTCDWTALKYGKLKMSLYGAAEECTDSRENIIYHI